MKLILIIILTALTVTAQPPEIEDFVLKGHKESHFKNVLLDPDSPISDFYLVTDDGNVLKVKDMGDNPDIQNVYSYPGKITEAESNEDVHYLSLASESETMMIATKDFIEIDTIYTESSAEITDFQIDNDKIYILSNDGKDGIIHYTEIGSTNWIEKSTPDVAFNRIFVMDSLVVLYKYLDDDVSVFHLSNLKNEWEKVSLLEGIYKYYTSLKDFDKKISLLGQINQENNRIYYLSNNLEYFFVTFAAIGNNVILDAGFEDDYKLKKNLEYIQSGYYDDECECAYLHKFINNGDGKDNRYLFPNSASLNKIKSNKRSKNIQFVAVGDDGLILLINRSLSGVEDKEKEIIIDESSFTYYPNPVKSNSEIIIESEKLIKSISISDLSGKNSVSYMQIGQYSYTLPISSIAKGVYFLTVNGKSQKFVVE